MGHVMHFYESQMQSLALMYSYFFRSFSLAIKLDTILSVVLLTKDSCIYREVKKIQRTKIFIFIFPLK